MTTVATTRSHVRRAAPTDAVAVGSALAAAFHDDPVFAWIWPAEEERGDAARAFFDAVVDVLALHDDIWTTTAGVTGAALWVPYGSPPMSEERGEQFGEELAALAGPRADRALALVAAMEERHPEAPHEYLWFAGVVPVAQGRGIGSALLAPVLERADQHGRPAYLEATSERNKVFYERCGFRAGAPFSAADGPPLWPMWREPATPGPARGAPGPMSTAVTTTDGHTDMTTDGRTTEACAEAVFAGILGMEQTTALYLGDRLGWYRSLAQDGPATAGELAARTGTAARYAREWLEHQAVCGLLTVDHPAAPPDGRRFAMPDAHVPVLADLTSESVLTPFARILVASLRRIDDLLEAYRTGGGVSWERLGDDAREGQSAQNRPLLRDALPRDHLPRLGEVDVALRAGGRVADVGCGEGWSGIGIARAYPRARVDGFDVDAASVEAARRHAAAEGVADRVRVHHSDVSAAEAGVHDLVCAFECVHDMPDPVGALAGMRRAVAPAGTVLVMDEKVADAFAPDGDDVEQLFYGFSLMCCLPDGLSTPGSVGTGTVMRRGTLESYARAAGFSGVEVLDDLEHDIFRFYRLVP
ncbi:GNAT family N-acetyltransferase [Actinomycetospora sp. TBRC 11914]|uniref:GNAT family N-acetyltransferase n=1 Tax=Actinomycetospora sp. TBRC 11914 TaxID=2729387 RepID=UPI00145D2AE3|nr:GNAT family N-acetyltransferase [Actinomycetospora sp. TBRC 11914]NMO93891.1 GNAT family N-acetyltransferase [Actinomycetospora sp. TBRC 11914]